MNRIRWSSLDTILFLGAHADDIEIGCGGTVLELCERKIRPQIVEVRRLLVP